MPPNSGTTATGVITQADAFPGGGVREKRVQHRLNKRTFAGREGGAPPTGLLVTMPGSPG